MPAGRRSKKNRDERIFDLLKAVNRSGFTTEETVKLVLSWGKAKPPTREEILEAAAMTADSYAVVNDPESEVGVIITLLAKSIRGIKDHDDRWWDECRKLKALINSTPKVAANVHSL